MSRHKQVTMGKANFSLMVCRILIVMLLATNVSFCRNSQGITDAQPEEKYALTNQRSVLETELRSIQPNQSPSNKTSTSTEWSGYGVASDYSNPQPVVTSVSSSWIVPRVTVTSDDRFSAAWLRLGGGGL